MPVIRLAPALERPRGRSSSLMGLLGAVLFLSMSACTEEPASPGFEDRGANLPADQRVVDRPGLDQTRLDAKRPDAASPACTAPTNRALRLFFVGNSFTQGGPIPTLVTSLATASGFPAPVAEHSLVGGYSLSQHRSLAATLAGIDKGGWDFVVLQEQSTKPTDNAGDPTGYKQDATWFYDRAKTSGPTTRVILYETWARHASHSIYPNTFKNPAQMQAQLRFHTNDAATTFIPKNAKAAVKTDVSVAPAGDAWEKHLAEPNPLNLFASDLYHADPPGQYLNAAVIFSTIYGCRALGLPSLSLASADAARLQKAADATTQAKGVPPGSQPLPFAVGTQVRIDFGPTATTAAGWNTVATVSGVLTNAVSTVSKATPLDVQVTRAFNGTNTEGRKDNTLGWPQTVTEDTLWSGSFDGHTAALKESARLELRDLPDGQYQIAIFASRAGKDGSLDRLTRYTLGSTSQDLDATDNLGKKVLFKSLVTAGQTLALEVAVSPAGTSRFAYLGAMEIERIK